MAVEEGLLSLLTASIAVQLFLVFFIFRSQTPPRERNHGDRRSRSPPGAASRKKNNEHGNQGNHKNLRYFGYSWKICQFTAASYSSLCNPKFPKFFTSFKLSFSNIYGKFIVITNYFIELFFSDRTQVLQLQQNKQNIARTNIPGSHQSQKLKILCSTEGQVMFWIRTNPSLGLKQLGRMIWVGVSCFIRYE